MICITNLVLSVIWTSGLPVYVSRFSILDPINRYRDYSADLNVWDSDLSRHPYYLEGTDPEHRHKSIPTQYALMVDEQFLSETERRREHGAPAVDTAILFAYGHINKIHPVSAYLGRSDTLRTWQLPSIFHNSRRSHRSRYSRPLRNKTLMLAKVSYHFNDSEANDGGF